MQRPASSSGQGTAPPRTLAPVRDLSPRRDVTRTTSGTASASSGGAHRRPGGGGRGHGDAEHSIFVGDLALDVTAEDLVDVFRNPSIGVPPQSEDEPRRLIKPFLSCSSAKVMSEPETNGSKGYGFVRFSNRDEMVRALVEMQGVYCCGRPSRSTDICLVLTCQPYAPRAPFIAVLRIVFLFLPPDSSVGTDRFPPPPSSPSILSLPYQCV
ncbi:uncharacterized protein EI90DRAFT_3075229 [Cantharellus anzutake]|uniref:uncharacterized protein n=1 Tax=Cantharellus anzutake TaxID=1750568 RepID=UPI00190624F7|nr:uncharacterized protein EI90DRAFT_3094105 [Cantharellus anzutake]XP_038911697.1 uncharacterized protein EI90DRAFT_3075229 [Cantharellus anzutake]KAF8312293.1 hypothetical protein EI90DRAFT_3094105 [Cantharellus anzutake]KAF8324616.1 hypothetical protein EI90DRAFT_3075229 [Cantharellus anzutake]